MTEHEITQLLSRLYRLLREIRAERLRLEEGRLLGLDAGAEHAVALALIKTVEEGLLHVLEEVLAALTQLRATPVGATWFRRELETLRHDS